MEHDLQTFVTESQNPLILVCFNDFLMQTFIYKHISLSISYDFKNSFYQMDLKLLFVIMNYHVYAGRPNTERVGVHIFAATHPATLCSGGVGWGWVGGY